MIGILKLSPRKWCIVQCYGGLSMLNGVRLEGAGTAKIIFGPVGQYSLIVDEMIRLTRRAYEDHP